MGFESRPARESVAPRDLELCVGNRRRSTEPTEVLCLCLQVAEIRLIGKMTGRLGMVDRHGDSLSSTAPGVRTTGRKEVRENLGNEVGFYPFRGPEASLY